MKIVHGVTISAAALAFIALPSGAAYASSPFANCAEAYEAGYANIPASHPYYSKALDRDGDGVACDNPPADFTPAPSASPTPKPTPSATSDVTAIPSTDGELAETGTSTHTPLLFGAGAALGVSGGLIVLGLRRRNRSR